MKHCSRCKRWLPRTEYTVNAAKRDGLQNYCRECQRQYLREHYAAQHEYYLAKAKRSNRKLRVAQRRLLERMKSIPCLDCGGLFPPWVMDFDHVRGIKLFNVSRGTRLTEKVMLTEASKCEIVCSNCHRDRTYKRLQGAHSSVWIERLATDEKAGGSSPPGRAPLEGAEGSV
jgi:hypothetical protein